MELEKAWFRPAACYLFAVRKMKKKEIAEIFGVDPHTVIKKDEWPASSPDLNPLDYAIWSILEAQVNAEAHNSVESLRQAINEAFENLHLDMFYRDFDDWPRRFDADIVSNRGHFK